MEAKLLLGDCLEVLKTLKSNSMDSLVTDPPAGISFMGKDWDKDKGGRDQWIAWMTEVMTECHRVMKPGAHGLVWAIPRTSHWTATALENAGFEVRDVVTHLFGSGFPKSLDISKAIDKAAGAKREVVALNPNHRTLQETGTMCGQPHVGDGGITTPATDAAKQWQGFGTALKPASEHWILVRKPISEKTVAANVLKHGVGGINIDASRIGPPQNTKVKFASNADAKKTMGSFEPWKGDYREQNQGRFPANLLLSHTPDCEHVGEKKFKRKGGGPAPRTTRKGTQGSGACYTLEGNDTVKGSYESTEGETVEAWNCTEDCPVRLLDEQSGIVTRKDLRTEGKSEGFGGGVNCFGESVEGFTKAKRPQDLGGGASRFFYVAKASRSDRNQGVQELLTWENADQNLAEKMAELNQLTKAISDDTMQVLNGIEWNTLWSGNSITDQCPLVFKSTISIILNLITELRTSNVSPLLNTKESILGAIKTIEANGSNLAALVDCIKKFQPTITNDQMATAISAKLALSNALLEIRNAGKLGNIHSTVKSTKLMEYLITLVTPPGATVLDPFMGSGSTGKAAKKLGFGFIGIEQSEEYLTIAERRIDAC